MKKMKKFLALTFAAMMLVSLCACGKKGNDANQAGMANPMVEVQSDEEFTTQLGITIDSSKLSDEAKLFIISGEMAHVNYTLDGAGGEVSVTLRASKKDEDISGIYGDMISSEMEYNGITISNRSSVSDEEDVEIYDFSKDGIKYCLIIEGQVSQMLIGEILDSTMLAVGIN